VGSVRPADTRRVTTCEFAQPRPRRAPGQVSTLVWLPLAYFGLGLLLFSQARLTLLQAHWAKEQMQVDPALNRRWAGWGLIFIVGITALALLMPAGDTMLGFHVLVWLMWAVALVGRVLLSILSCC